MLDDSELLRRYAASRAGDDFAAVVQRHVDFVYSAALRQVNGDAHLAADVVQLVFADLARKAGRVAQYRVLAGWLFTSTRFAAAKAIRGEQRRRKREREAHTMEELNRDPAAQIDWERVRPVLDAALAELDEQDRAAILLRFFEGRGFAAVGERLELSENTARMRVERALDKLHAQLSRHGVTSTAAALAVTLTGQAVTAAPVGLAASVTGTVLAGAGGVGAATVFMGITKTQIALWTTLLAVGAGGLTLQRRANARLAAELATLRRTVAGNETIRGDTERLTRAAGEAQLLTQAGAADLARLSEEAETLKARLAAEAKSAGAASQRNGDSAKPATIYDVAQLDQVPKPKFRAPPVYPGDERAQGLEGKVLVEFVLDPAGEVTKAKAVEATNEAFAASAVAALKTWKFEPGRKGGVAVGVRMRQPITFTINKAPASTNWFNRT